MKKLIDIVLVLLCAALTFTFVACGENENPSAGESGENPSVTDTLPSESDDKDVEGSGDTDDKDKEQSGEEDGNKIPEVKPNNTYQVRTENLYVNSENGRIFAVLYFPQGVEGKRPAAVISHGFNNTSSMVAQYARALASQGYIACCFDFRGGGTGSRSDGSSSQMSALTERDDLEVIVDMMQAREDVDNNNLFLLGLSQGGVVTSLVAAKTPEKFAAVVLLSPALVLVDDARKLYNSIDEIPETPAPLMGYPIGKKYYEDILELDIYEAIKGNTRPTLIFHGTNDNIVPLSYSQKAVTVLPDATLETLQGEGHMYSNKAPVIAKLSEFLQYNLRSGNN